MSAMTPPDAAQIAATAPNPSERHVLLPPELLDPLADDLRRRPRRDLPELIDERLRVGGSDDDARERHEEEEERKEREDPVVGHRRREIGDPVLRESLP